MLLLLSIPVVVWNICKKPYYLFIFIFNFSNLLKKYKQNANWRNNYRKKTNVVEIEIYASRPSHVLVKCQLNFFLPHFSLLFEMRKTQVKKILIKIKINIPSVCLHFCSLFYYFFFYFFQKRHFYTRVSGQKLLGDFIINFKWFFAIVVVVVVVCQSCLVVVCLLPIFYYRRQV